MFKYYTLSGLIVFGTALLIAIVLSIISLPYFNQLIQANINLLVLCQAMYLLPFLSFLVLLFFVISFYPALLFSGINPVNLFKGKLGKRIKLSRLSKVLLVFQFVATIVLFATVMLISKQIRFMESKNPGFNADNLINLEIHYSIKDNNRIATFANVLRESPNVKGLAMSEGIPFEIHMRMGQRINDKDLSYMKVLCDTAFLPLLGVKLLKGRMFLPSDKDSYVITNQLAKDCGFKDPMNQKFGGGVIIGVVNDIHTQSLHELNKGVSFTQLRGNTPNMTIRIDSKNVANTIAFIKKKWQHLFPEHSINYQVYNEMIARQYIKEQNLAKSILIITVLAIFLCCLGLIGIVTNIVESHTREIGIRKVNDAKVSEILAMLNFDFVKWVAIAFVIACPIAYYAMHKWLQKFAYKTELSWWIFAVAGLTALVITMLTVSWQSWRAATRNPVESLRSE